MECVCNEIKKRVISRKEVEQIKSHCTNTHTHAHTPLHCLYTVNIYGSIKFADSYTFKKNVKKEKESRKGRVLAGESVLWNASPPSRPAQGGHPGSWWGFPLTQRPANSHSWQPRRATG